MKKFGNFYLGEYIPKEVYERYGGKAERFISKNMIITSNIIREYFNRPTIINNWMFKEKFNYRGLRMLPVTHDPETGKPFAVNGEHYFGTAFDCHVNDILAEEVYNEILDHQHIFHLVSRIKLYPTFVHIETFSCTEEYLRPMIYTF